MEDLSLAAQHVLHRLQEVAPRRLVLVACHPRGDPPGTIRLRVVDREPPPDADDVHLRLGESTSGVVDLDHVLAVTRWFGALPRDTVVLEVEPASVEFGTRLSPVGERALDEVVELATSEALRIASRT